MLNPSSNKLQRYKWSAVYQGSQLEIQCLWFLLGAGHTGVLLYPNPRLPEENQALSIDNTIRAT